MKTAKLMLFPRTPAFLKIPLAALLAAALMPAAQAAMVSKVPARLSLPSATPGSVILPASGFSNPLVAPGPVSGPSLLLPSGQGIILPAAAGPAVVTQPSLALPFAAAAPQQIVVPQSGLVARVRENVDRQLDAMAGVLKGRDDRLLASVSEDAHLLLAGIQEGIDAGEIDPSLGVDVGPEAGDPPSGDRPVKVGIYPVTADPFHWGHLLIGLQAVGSLKLDKVVFILAGDDPRKPNMTKTALRHPMGQAVLAAFAPFFDYSPIAIGTNLDGETNMFRLLAHNLGRRVHAFYLVGTDHYKLTDKNGNPDTLPKIEANMTRPELGFDPLRHKVSVAFIERDLRGPAVPTDLDVRFLPSLPFDASSTKARAGALGMMPYDAYRWVLERGLGLYGIH
ncbi:MAG: hypothetical protein WC943_02050 [Elusimicrobiota bacterium]|jgi:hypothetical protein